MGKKTYSFGPDLGRETFNWPRMFVKSRKTANDNVYIFDFEQAAMRFNERPVCIAEHYRVTGTQSGRMSSRTPNISSEPKRWVLPNRSCMWCGGRCRGHDEVIVDEESMQLICAKVGVPTSMTDPVKLQKYRDRAYGDKRSLAYS